ncbi:Rossmann-like and DUF2520 domain-containing protein [Parachitinimonas caeni]|uniref:DUF2520 domain-containing protein n=1 Tax=Parachitinimonas caeni TaxID=3031301 RepID=A0ABT7DXH8_9NEIS|nr:Rossmann-like and DUF2520 domain-containing protein [Parachitinimonas caeni]MDK2124771.1 DUF2520 domain-containing protein [Parachitinimonas caeni]
MHKLPTLNLIGAGQLGRSVAKLFIGQKLVFLQSVATRSLETAQAACDWLEAGRACTLPELPAADFTLLAVSDDQLASVCIQIAPQLRAGSVVFHCSGSQSSEVLLPAQQRGAVVASVHPLRSFADPAAAVAGFAGTFCACEGDAKAMALLGPMFDRIGARRFAIDPSAKVLYHAGAVFACNYLVALMDAGLACFEAAGVERSTAFQALKPLIDGTLANVGRVGTVAALSGPIARGDVATVDRQQAALAAKLPTLVMPYQVLGQIAVRLAEQRPGQDRQAMCTLASLLQQGDV